MARATYFVHIRREYGAEAYAFAELRKVWWSKTEMQTRSRSAVTACIDTTGLDERDVVPIMLRELALAWEDRLA